MATSITYNLPNDICFVGEGVEYTLVISGSAGGMIVLKFDLTLPDLNGGGISETFEISCSPVRGISSYIYHADLSDIIQSYIKKYWTEEEVGDSIYGYAIIQLTHVDETAIAQDDHEHICLPGISGGLNLDGSIPPTTHPFLLARGNEEGALHFYRSELNAMQYIYALKTNAYDDLYIETDDREYPDQDLEGLMHFIDDYTFLLSIYFGTDDLIQYDITQANAIFLNLVSIELGGNRLYTIAIQDDPDTDELHLIRWTNSMGAPEALLLTGELQDKSEVDKPELYISNQTIRSIERKMQRGTVTTKYILHTGYLTPARIIALKDMLTSEDVEMQIDGQWIPVSITADTKHAVHQREPESFELTIEVLEQTRYHKPNRTVRPLPSTRAGLLQDNRGNLILDNNSNTIEENGSV